MKRFWDKVANTGSDGCWLWTASQFKRSGYGCFAFRGKTWSAHRVAWTLTHGDPGGLFVCHKCDVKTCCNPTHLFLGTARDNSADMVRKGRGGRTAKLDVAAAVALWRTGLTQRQIAAQLGVTAPCVWQALHGKRKEKPMSDLTHRSEAA